MNTTGKGFGKRLRKLRKAAGLTQAALGEKAGVHPVSIAQYETGVCKPSEKSAAKLEGFFEGYLGKATPLDPSKPKKRGRPRKVKAEDAKRAKSRFHQERVVPLLLAHSKKAKAVDPGLVQDVIAEPISIGFNKAKARGESMGVNVSPVKLGAVSLAWVEQQVESFVKVRGHVFQDGPVRVVVMSRPDVVALCRLMLEVGGVRVE